MFTSALKLRHVTGKVLGGDTGKQQQLTTKHTWATAKNRINTSKSMLAKQC